MMVLQINAFQRKPGVCTLLLWIAATFSLSALGSDSEFIVGAMGDSLSTGFNAYLPLNNKRLSWTTGTSSDEINSHYFRLQRVFPNAIFQEFNVAFPGVTSNALPKQAEKLSLHRPDYVTVSIGANDLCQASTQEPINPSRLIHNVESSIKKIITAKPKVKILLGLIPDILMVTEVVSENTRCRAQYKILPLSCKVALSPKTSPEEKMGFQVNRDIVNKALVELAKKYSANMKTPPLKIADYKFGIDLISKIDCFHPNLKGQQLLAELMWKNGWYPNN